MSHSKWLAKLGAVGYDLLILINAFVNWCLNRVGHEKISLSKRIKDRVKSAVKFVNDFEKTAADIAIDNQYDYVVCGHIHKPEISQIKTEKGDVIYMNSGDWVENLTALEYDGKNWSIYKYHEDPYAQSLQLPRRLADNRNNDEIFKDLVSQFMTLRK
jgi:UDP-2,3-diacylglucosamine pyrophosphatase LpxH